MLRSIALRGERASQNVSHLQQRAFKQTIHAKQCGDSTQAHV